MPARFICGGLLARHRAQSYIFYRDFLRYIRSILCGSRGFSCKHCPQSAATPVPVCRHCSSTPIEASLHWRYTGGTLEVQRTQTPFGTDKRWRNLDKFPFRNRPLSLPNNFPSSCVIYTGTSLRGSLREIPRIVQGYDKMILFYLRGNAYLCLR